jgi:hypothetical protein
MPDPSTPFADPDEARALLRVVAHLLYQADQLGPEAQRSLGEFLNRYADALEEPKISAEDLTRLTERAFQLAQTIHQGEERGVVTTVRDRLEAAIIAADAEYPTASGIGRRLMETLSNLGI